MSETTLSPIDLFLSRTDEGGLEKLRRRNSDFNLVESMEYVSAIRKLVLAAREQDHLLVPDNWTADLYSHLETLNATLERAETFSPKDEPDPNATFQTIVADITAQRNWIASHVTPFVGTGDVDVAAIAAETLEDSRRAKQAAEDALRILGTLRSESGGAGADTLAAYYAGQAGKHEKAAAKNLRNTMIALVVVGALIVAFFVWPLRISDPSDNSDWWETFVRGLAPRLLVLGLAAFALSFFARNYRVERHLQVVNEHKRNALQTYSRFVEAVTSDEQRDSVTIELVRRVFENVDTGFITATTDKTVVETTPTLLSAVRPPS